ncbi:MAG: hypothetical protein DMF87_19355 [Acidobacteria bacterium]|nr:MAG: hypothetical protein DMF88_15870 [Acidobacteriota bacterium]PYR75864.1 MAG: hypothetical protein DMF87_19355 [Acidobacteriota bacterium]
MTVRTAEGKSDAALRGRVAFVTNTGTTVSMFGPVSFAARQSFRVPAFPAVQALRCDITLDGYRPQPSQVFIPHANQTLEAPVTAMRSPGDWTPAFRPFGELDPDRFARFIRVAKASDAVSFITQAPPLGSLVTAYDNLAGDQGQFAKMALLNLYAVLSDEDDPVSGTRWFELVRKIVRIDRERFVAEVDPQVFSSVRTILGNLNQFGYKPEPSPELHRHNFPDVASITDLITVKKSFEQGTIQWTVAKTQTAAGATFYLDVDADEHEQIALHTIDLFKHKFNGGTHPIDIHEYLVAHAAKQDAGEINLGYELVRRV